MDEGVKWPIEPEKGRKRGRRKRTKRLRRRKAIKA